MESFAINRFLALEEQQSAYEDLRMALEASEGLSRELAMEHGVVYGNTMALELYYSPDTSYTEKLKIVLEDSRHGLYALLAAGLAALIALIRAAVRAFSNRDSSSSAILSVTRTNLMSDWVKGLDVIGFRDVQAIIESAKLDIRHTENFAVDLSVLEKDILSGGEYSVMVLEAAEDFIRHTPEQVFERYWTDLENWHDQAIKKAADFDSEADDAGSFLEKEKLDAVPISDQNLETFVYFQGLYEKFDGLNASDNKFNQSRFEHPKAEFLFDQIDSSAGFDRLSKIAKGTDRFGNSLKQIEKSAQEASRGLEGVDRPQNAAEAHVNRMYVTRLKELIMTLRTVSRVYQEAVEHYKGVVSLYNKGLRYISRICEEALRNQPDEPEKLREAIKIISEKMNELKKIQKD